MFLVAMIRGTRVGGRLPGITQNVSHSFTTNVHAIMILKMTSHMAQVGVESQNKSCH